MFHILSPNVVSVITMLNETHDSIVEVSCSNGDTFDLGKKFSSMMLFIAQGSTAP